MHPQAHRYTHTHCPYFTSNKACIPFPACWAPVRSSAKCRNSLYCSAQVICVLTGLFTTQPHPQAALGPGAAVLEAGWVLCPPSHPTLRTLPFALSVWTIDIRTLFLHNCDCGWLKYLKKNKIKSLYSFPSCKHSIPQGLGSSEESSFPNDNCTFNQTAALCLNPQCPGSCLFCVSHTHCLVF